MAASTGSPALDEILSGGIPETRPVLVTGTPGTGKSTLGMQFLQAGLAAGEDCLFVSTEQTADELRDSFAPFGFDLDHDRLAVTSVHATPGRTLGGDGRELVVESLGAENPFAGFEAPFTSDRIREVLGSYEGCDRIVLDSVSGLRPMAEGPEAFRRAVIDLIQLFSREFEATSLLTAEAVGSALGDGAGALGGEHVLEYNTHGVVRMWLERIQGDYHRFLDVMKMRGVDHDTRQFEIKFGDGGVEIVPRRRVHADAFLSHDHQPTGIAGLDGLAGGGILRGTTALLEHDGRASFDAVITSLLATALADDLSLTLVPTVDTNRAQLDAMLDAQLGPEAGGVDDLLADDRLFVLDPTGAWEGDDNVFDLREAKGLVPVLERVADRRGAAPHLTLLDTAAAVHALDASEARDACFRMEAEFLAPGDVFVCAHNPEVLPESLATFYADAASQVFETWLEDTGLQYVRLEKCPTGELGATRLVEFTDEAPYVSVR